MPRRSGWVVAVAALAITMGACAMEGVDGPEPQTVTQEVAVGPCPDGLCGLNSPVVDSLHFHELNLKGVPNAQGLVIDAPKGAAQIVSGNIAYDLHVHHGYIKGVRGSAVIEGLQLVGATIPILRDKSRFSITIRGVRELPFFIGDPGKVGVYKLEVSIGDGSVANLCNNTTLVQKQIAEQGGLDSPFAEEELMGMYVWETVVFEGDRFYPTTMTTSHDFEIDDNWINIGCATHTLAKLLLTHNAYHSQPLGTLRAWEQRQATMKMLAADYCGGGIPFTVSGQELVWTGGSMSYNRPPRELEARWDEKGATCLNVPRLVHPTSTLGSSTFPDVKLAIRTRCVWPVSPPPPPPCLDRSPANMGTADRMSANP